MERAAFACTCGKVQGHLAPAAFSKGTHIHCHCADCRAACQHITGQARPYVDLLLTTPGQYSYDTGTEHLRVLHLSPRGVHRVYASCCGSLMHSLPTARALAFASLYIDRLTDPARAGKPRARIYQTKRGKPYHQGMSRVVYGVLSRALSAHLGGTWRDGPFYDAQNALAFPADLISPQDKAKAYAAIR